MPKLLIILVAILFLNAHGEVNDNIKCAAYFIEQKDLTIKFFETTTKAKLYTSLIEASNIQISILRLNALVEYYTGNTDQYSALINEVNDFFANIDELQRRYDDILAQTKVLLQLDINVIKKYATTSCESYIPNLKDSTEACKTYGDKLKETIECKYIKRLTSMDERNL